jgi:hypothetical protein
MPLEKRCDQELLAPSVDPGKSQTERAVKIISVISPLRIVAESGKAHLEFSPRESLERSFHGIHFKVTRMEADDISRDA